jgi:hypothetical protein
MLERVRKQITYANVMATIAVFVAIGGTARSRGATSRTGR